MSWARLDDQMTWNAKIVRAGNEAVGAWTRMLAHACAQLTDGHIERDVALAIAPKKVLDRAVSAGLIEVDGPNYRIHDFHDWNPSASVVREKREADKARKAAGRSVQVRDESGRMTSGRPSSVRADTERIPPDRPPVPSYSRPDPDPRESESARPDELPSGVHRTASTPQREVRLDEPLTPELREAAAMIGVRDIDTAWLKFTGSRAGRTEFVAGAWQAFCASWKANEAKERDRDAARGPRNVRMVQPPAEGAPSWKLPKVATGEES